MVRRRYELSRTGRGHGWIPDRVDHRDRMYVWQDDPDALARAEHTPHVDLSTSRYMPRVWDQQHLNSCVAHATGAALEFAARRSGVWVGDPSRLFIYYEGCKREATDNGLAAGDVTGDPGMAVRTGMKVLAQMGVPPEKVWPYDTEKSADPPPDDVVEEAERHKAWRYFGVKPYVTRLKAVLAGGLPICFGFYYYPSFDTPETEQTGVVPLPSIGETNPKGHAALLVGYDETGAEKRFIARNSWGEDWGRGGYFTMPYRYFTEPGLTADFWTVLFAS